MEIERKFLIKSLPDDLNHYPCDTLTQAYVSTEPVIRVRQKNTDYILTLKSSGLLAREEVEMPLSEESFTHLLTKKDGISIEKKRYKIPDTPYLIELDVFEGDYSGFCMAEVEFPDIEHANAYKAPSIGRTELNLPWERLDKVTVLQEKAVARMAEEICKNR